MSTNNYNSTQVFVEVRIIERAANNAILAVNKKQAELKEEVIQMLVKPYRYLVFWKKRRTREEAEIYLKLRRYDWNDLCWPIFTYHITFGNELLLKCKALLSACKLLSRNEEFITNGMWLSLNDAEIVNRWKDVDKVE
jgi:hypothetical protein